MKRDAKVALCIYCKQPLLDEAGGYGLDHGAPYRCHFFPCPVPKEKEEQK